MRESRFDAIVLQLIKNDELQNSQLFKKCKVKYPDLNPHDDNLILCFKNRKLRSFLRFFIDVDSRGIQYPNSDIYLECIETFPGYRNQGFGTIILNGLYAIALQETRGIYAITSKEDWFVKRGFHFNKTESNFQIPYNKIKIDNSIINRIRSGEIIPSGIIFP